jgi:predicted MFS family arabinose efflux permease
MKTTISSKSVVAFALTSFFLFFEMAVQVSPNVMAPSLMHDLHLNSTMLGFISSVYFYSYALMMIPVGLLYDRFKINHLLIIAISALAAGNVMFAASSDLYLLALARFLMGFGSAFAFVGVLVVAKSCFEVRYFPLLVGITQFMAAIGAMIGEAPVALLVNHLGWRHTSLCFAVFAAILIVSIALFVRGCTDGAKDHDIKQSFVRVLRNKQTYVVALFAFSSWAPITIYAALWGVPYLMARFAISNTVAAIAPMLVWLSLALTSPIIGRLVAKNIAHKTLMQLVLFIGCVGSLIIIYLPGLSFIAVVILSITIGVGAAGQILSFDLVRMNNSDAEFALATGFNNVGVVFGGAILQPLFGYLVNAHWAGTLNSVGDRIYSVGAYSSAMWLIPACFAAGFIVSRYFIDYKTPHN